MILFGVKRDSDCLCGILSNVPKWSFPLAGIITSKIGNLVNTFFLNLPQTRYEIFNWPKQIWISDEDRGRWSITTWKRKELNAKEHESPKGKTIVMFYVCETKRKRKNVIELKGGSLILWNMYLNMLGNKSIDSIIKGLKYRSESKNLYHLDYFYGKVK